MAVIELLHSRVVTLEPILEAEIQLLHSRVVTLEPLVGIQLLDSRVVTLEPIPEVEYDFTIVAKQLEIMGTGKLSIPVTAEVPQDSEAKVWVTVRNTGYIGGHPRCRWEVREPDGILLSPYDHTAFEMISPGEEHKFYEAFETFTLRKEGNYTIQIWLQSSESGAEVLDYWSGKLCTVRAEAPPPPPPECEIDADCLPGYICVHGKCVLEEEVEKEFPWLPVALIGGGVVIAGAAALKAKKKKA